MQSFASDNESKEAAFQAAVSAVQQAASEQELDERVAAALISLDSYGPPVPVCCTSAAVVSILTACVDCMQLHNAQCINGVMQGVMLCEIVKIVQQSYYRGSHGIEC